MTTPERVLLTFYSLLVTAAGGLVLAIVAGWNAPLESLDLVLGTMEYRIGLGVIAAIASLIGLKLFVGSFRRPSVVQAVISTNNLGEVRISLPALENLIIRTAGQVKGVKEVRPQIKIGTQGITISLKTVMSPDVVIPAGAEELQKLIKKSIEQSAGVEVLQVRVLIDGVGHELRGRVE